MIIVYILLLMIFWYYIVIIYICPYNMIKKLKSQNRKVLTLHSDNSHIPVPIHII